MPWLKALGWPLACFAGYLLLALLVFRAGLPAGHLVGDGGDARQFAWFLAWDRFALAGHHLLLTDWIDFPTGVNLAWNTSVPALGVPLAPLTALAGPLVAYNVALVGSVALAALTGQIFAQQILGSRPGSVIAGAVYGFSPYMISHALGHLDTILWTPPLVGLLLRATVFGRSSPFLLGAGLGLVAGLQAWIGEEFVLTTALASLVALAVLAWVAREHVRREHVRRLALAGAACVPVVLLVAGWLLWVQFTGPNRVLRRPPNDIFGNDLLGPLIPNGLQLLGFGSTLATRMPLAISEQNAYLGAPLLALWAWIAITRWSPLVAWATLTSVVLFLLSLGPRLYLAGHALHVPFLWRPFLAVPLLDNVLPSRLMAFVFLAAGLICGWYLANTRALGRTALALALLPLLPTAGFPSVAVDVPAYFTAGHTGGVVLVLPWSAEGDATAMLWQSEAGMRFKMPEGYARVPGPDGRALQAPVASPLADAMTELKEGTPAEQVDVAPDAVRAQLKDVGVDEVVVGPCPEHDQAVAYFTALLGRPPAPEADVLVWRL